MRGSGGRGKGDAEKLAWRRGGPGTGGARLIWELRGDKPRGPPPRGGAAHRLQWATAAPASEHSTRVGGFSAQNMRVAQSRQSQPSS